MGDVWNSYVIRIGDEHHDGAKFVDFDNDGDFDIISIGSSHSNVHQYENKTINN